MLNIFKKSAILFLCVLFILISFSGCEDVAENTDKKTDTSPIPIATPINQTPIADYESIKEITWLRVADNWLSNYTREYLLLNFGLKVNERHYSNQNMTERILMNYSAGIGPELATGISVSTMKTLAQNGYLYDFYSDKSSVSNYFGLWDDWQNGWQYTAKEIEMAKLDSGEKALYGLVPINRKASKAWIYNKKLFDDNNILFPSTVNELYDLLARYKRDNPKAGPAWISKSEVTQFAALLNAYGLSEDKWQTDANGKICYLYAQKGWYDAFEWLTKLEKLGAVPVDEKGVIKAYDEKEYAQATKKAEQIIAFTDSYNYMYVENTQKGNSEWAVANVMIAADNKTIPVLKSNIPYIREVTCICKTADETAIKQMLVFLNWCCSDDGNMWVNFGENGVGYKINADSSFTFLKYYSDEMTPSLSAKNDGSISDITIGRLFTTVPWEKINISGVRDRYSAEEEFLNNAKYRLLLPELFSDRTDAVENRLELWDYEQIINELDRITEDFIDFTRENGFSDYYWNRYYDSLIQAGLEKYTDFMQKRKL